MIPGGETPWLDAIGAGRHVSNVLIDGMLRGTWWLDVMDRRTTSLVVRPLGRISRHERSELRAEAKRLAGFVGATDVRLEPPAPTEG